jgi:UDP-glucose 4-epimerase
MQNQRILITGGSGYIGKIADRILRNKGYETVILDIVPFPNHPNFFLGDIRNISVFDTIFSKWNISTVLHLAGHIAARESVQKSSFYFQNNYQGTHNLIQSMKKHQIPQLVFASTAAVYSPNTLLSEEDTLYPNTPYGWSKLYCEKAIQQSNISAYILRLFNVGGALNTLQLGENHNPETHFIPLAIDANIHQKNLILYGEKNDRFMGCTRDYIHVEDVVRAFLQCIKQPLPKKKHKILNICTNKGYRVEQIVKITESISGKKTKIQSYHLPKNESYILVGNNQNTIRELDWNPIHSIEQIVQSAWVYQTKHEELK